MRKTTVLVVDDSAFMRKVLSEILSTDSEIEVIGTARNGHDAIKKVSEMKPDVVTMDIEMPLLNGLEALQIIMRDHPTPVVMISSLTQQGAEPTFRALELGAVDFVSKPSGSISLDIHKVKDQLIERVKSAAQAKLVALPFRTRHSLKSESVMPNEKSDLVQSALTNIPHLIAIGVSTGGPNALKCLLEGLPGDFPAALFIVQHMPANFTKTLAQRLDTLSELTVVEAEQGMNVQEGFAYIAPGGFHMLVRHDKNNLKIHLSKGEPVANHRPSVDVLFESISKLRHPSKYAVILTGMGSDGTKGLGLMKGTGCREAIAEAESSCVIYGMPRSAILSGNIDRILPIHEIGPYLARKLKMENER